MGLVFEQMTIAAVSSCPWDCVGNDGEIGIDEFLAVLGRWGVAPNNPCDFDGDGMVDEDEIVS